MRPTRSVEIHNRLTRQLTVGDFDGDIIHCPQSGRAPIDFNDFRVAAVHQQPISVFERFADLQRDTSEDIPNQVLRRQADNHRGDARRNQQRLDALVVPDLEHQEDGDNQDDHPHHLGQEFRDFDPMALLEIQLPKVAIHQSDENTGAQNDRRRAQVPEKGPVQVQQQSRHVHCHAEREEVIEPAQTHPMLPLQPPPRQDHQAI